MCTGGGYSKEDTKFVNVALYISFFPQLIAGPIVRYNSIAEQINGREHSFDKFSLGMKRFTIGLAKKAILANQLAQVKELAFTYTENPTVLLAWAGALAAILQIYFDFSGYSDMAIGLGKMFGFDFQENFDYPLASTSITEYWRRWHISLTQWFRDYLFYPLSFGPGIKARKYLSERIGRKAAGTIVSSTILLIVWTLTGLWHGANMTFLLWGFIQFVILFIEQRIKPWDNKKLQNAVGHVTTFIIATLGIVIFSSPSIGSCIEYYGNMFCFISNPFTDYVTNYWMGQYKIVLLLGMIFAFPIVPAIKNIKKSEKAEIAFEIVDLIILIALFVVAYSTALTEGYNPFIYFNF